MKLTWVVIAVPLLGPVSSAAVVVDWLALQNGGNASGFTLVRDGGSPAAGGVLSVTHGFAFPGLPSSRVLNASYWESGTGFVNSASGDGTVEAFDIRVAPASGMSSYVLDLAVPSGVPLVLAIGELLKDSTSATSAIAISAFSDAGQSAVELATMVAWDNGLQAFDQDLDWDPVAGSLSPAAGADGQSQVALFRIAPIGGNNATIRLSVASGYAAGTGDSVVIGLGTVIPEPAVLLLTTFGAVLLFGRRR